VSHHKPNPALNVNLVIDGKPVTVPEGTSILEAAKKINVRIPTLCHHPDLCKRAFCRLCVVECDGRGKLVAACSNDVWEGVNVVTGNPRILEIRKTILEMILANHPRECLVCTRGMDCELLDLAILFGIYNPVFRRNAVEKKNPVTENEIIVRDMHKCVKCGRCMEGCMEVQTVGAINSSRRSVRYTIDTPYDQALVDGPCVFCGHCAEVCPVGAIHGYEQSHEAWAALKDGKLSKAASEKNAGPAGDRHSVVAQVEPALSSVFDAALGLPPGTVTPGKMVSGLKRLGFDKVFDMQFSKSAALTEESRELLDRVRGGGKIPMLSGCSQSLNRFTADFFPDLKDHVSPCRNPVHIFGSLNKGTESAKTTNVSIVPCPAKKYVERKQERNADLVLTVSETAAMFRLAGIGFRTIEETPFDVMPGKAPENLAAFDPSSFRDVRPGVREIEFSVKETRIRMMTVHGFGNARLVMDSIRRGECRADFVKVMNCPRKDCSAAAGSEMASVLCATCESRF